MSNGNKRSTKKLIALLAAVVIIALFAVFLLLNHSKVKPDYVTATGVMEATEVTLSPRTQGALAWLCCKEGESLAKGQVALRLDSRELRARIEESRAAVIAAGEGMKEAEAVLESAKAAHETAKNELSAAVSEVQRVKAITDDSKENFERAKGLLKDGYISKRDYDTAGTAFNANTALLSSARARKRSADGNLNMAAVNIKAATARISSAKAKKAQAEAQLKVLVTQLEDTEVASPIDGVVVNKAFEAGENVPAGAPVYTIFDLKNIWARVDVEETDAVKIKLGGPAKVTAPGLVGREFDASVIEVGSVAEFATQKDVTRGRQEIKSFRVKAGVSNADGLLKPGMTVEVRFYPGATAKPLQSSPQ